ncbi:MAG: methyltetrahydrofolate cobalamin methyltransferase [Atribacterota bacterium]
MLIIGEKLNSTRKSVKEMIENRDIESVQELARIQVEGGARMLDINSSTASGDREENMKWLVRTVQKVVKVPLCIDSPDAREIEKGLEAHNWTYGKALINSITGEKERIDSLLPVIKKYKCAVVALVMDERGIPDNARIRIEIANKLIDVLTDSGVPLADVYIDPLTMPIGISDQNGLTVLNTIRGIKDLHPDVKTIIGLSNISYGLPQRKVLNQVFMVLAMSYGLDTAIVDPTDQRLMSIIGTSLTLLGKDSYCGEYIKAYREGRICGF